MYDSIQERIAESERAMLRRMAEMEREENRGQEAPKLSNASKARKIQSQGDEPKRGHWRRRMHTLILDKNIIAATDRVDSTR
jgi:hypothetical protein